MRFAAGFVLLTLPIALLGAMPALAADPASDPRDAAITLYDQGRYREARLALQALDDAGKADGSLLYRLAFCAGSAGDEGERARLMERSIAALEKETAAGGTVESWFYLSNAYRNLGRVADSTRVAGEATSRLETGKWKAPERGVDVFRIAKIYADGGRDDQAAAWYRKTVAALTPEAARYPSYLRWARRFLGDLAMHRMQWEPAATEYAAVVAIPDAIPADWHKLAVARVRMGKWQDAADAWRRAEQLDPGGGDDARYSRQIALQAAALESVPALTPDSRTWDKPSQEELESLMIQQAKVAAEARPQAPEGGQSTAAPAPDLPARLEEAHKIFVAAAIEYAARGLPIRETAFTKGFAPLVFHPEQWEMPGPEE